MHTRAGNGGAQARPAVVLTASFIALALLAGCTRDGPPAPPQPSPPPDGKVQYLSQGWDANLRGLAYHTPQGSMLMPYAWFLALERADGGGPFASEASLTRYGFLASEEKRPQLNPDGLPIGFAREPAGAAEAVDWVGVTCSACHTNDVTYRQTRLRIDGAPAAIDFDTFYHDLALASKTTRPEVSPERFARFADKVLGAEATEEQRQGLRARFAAYEARLQGDAAIRHPTLQSGYGRVDALTEIINAIAVTDLGKPENLRSVSAPVSYPQLWLSSKLDWVQWFPIASNPLARNVGEVLGVFGRANLTGPQDQLFTSTARIKDLVAMEHWIDDLSPPPWPEEIFGPIDVALAKKGKQLFDRDCRGCHNMPPFDLTDAADNIVGKRFIKIGRADFRAIGTDPVYMQSLIGRTVFTGSLAPVLFQNRPLVSGPEYFRETVGAVVRKALSQLQLSREELLAYNDFRFHPPAAPDQPPEAYEPPPGTYMKAGPLMAMWATGPFLHNGSVPNIYELLSPPAERSKVFWVGSREIDVVKLGFESVERPGLFRYDTAVPGNSNQGHAKPATPYGHDERMAVIEYLKAPERFAEVAGR